MWGPRIEKRFGLPTWNGDSAMLKFIKMAWAKTKEAINRLRAPTRKAQRTLIITRVIYMWKPALTIRRCRIDHGVAAAAGQLSLF